MHLIELTTRLEVYATTAELSPAERALLAQAQAATQRAYAPYSQFWVGAALLLADGTVVRGSNQENAAYPSGLCAERTAVYWAGTNHAGTPWLAIAVAACRAAAPDHWLPANPCGACRQALLEYEVRQGMPIRVLMHHAGGGVCVAPSVASLLPLAFTALNL